MRNRLIATCAMSLLVLSAACSAGSGDNAAGGNGDSEIRIGLTLDLTGGGSLVGQGVKYGVEMAEAEINAHGGINGRKIHFVQVDSASTPDGGTLAVRKLVQSEKVPLIFGGSVSSSTVAALAFVRSSKIPYYASIPSDPRVLTPFSKYIFEGAAVPQGTVVPEEVKFLTEQLKVSRIGVIGSSDAYAVAARELLLSTARKSGLKVTTTQKYSAGDTDFTPQLQAIRDSKPDAIFSIGLPGDAAKVLAQARRLGIAIPMIGDSAQADNQTISLAGPAAENYYTFWFSSRQFLDDTTGVMGSWLSAFHQQFPSAPSAVPNQWTLQSYADVYVLAEALTKTGGSTDANKLLSALEGIHDFVAGPDGSLPYAHPVGLPRGFTAEDHQGSRTLVPVQVHDGHFKPVAAGQ